MQSKDKSKSKPKPTYYLYIAQILDLDCKKAYKIGKSINPAYRLGSLGHCHNKSFNLIAKIKISQTQYDNDIDKHIISQIKAQLNAQPYYNSLRTPPTIYSRKPSGYQECIQIDNIREAKRIIKSYIKITK